MTPRLLLALTVNPVLSYMQSDLAVISDDRSRQMLLTIALQECDLKHRKQVGGPAVSWWQFERGGGIAGVLHHGSSAERIKKACAMLCVEPTAAAIYSAMPQNDLLSCIMARLLLYTDPRTLPGLGDVQGGWNYYERNWRPGKPHPEKWPGYWQQAGMALRPE